MKKDRLVMAAVAGILAGAASARPAQAAEPVAEVKCWGVNSCGSHAGCSVTDADVAAAKTLVGEKEYATKFSKTETHSCASHAKCGASSKILNWTKTAPAACHDKGGMVIEESEGKKVAKKA